MRSNFELNLSFLVVIILTGVYIAYEVWQRRPAATLSAGLWVSWVLC